MAVWQSTKLNIAPDNGAHYNTSSGKYCAEFYGIYAFHLHLVKVSAANTAACAIQKDHAGSLETLAATTVNPGTVTSSISTIVDLERGDCVYAGECFAIDLLSSSTSFSGALLDPLE